MTTKTSRKLISSALETDGKVSVAQARVETYQESQLVPVPLPWLTLETLSYALLFIGALALRLWHLDLYPLSNVEAAQSWPALELYRGAPPTADSYSPLLLSFNALTFLLLGVNDFTARLAPALLGSLIVILPVALRRQLGPRVCLLAAALLALSPTAVYLSRTLNSEVALAAGALLLVAGFFNWAENGRQPWLYLAAAGLTMLFTAGPMVYSILIVFGLIILLKFAAFKVLWVQGLSKGEAETSATAAAAEITAGDGQEKLPTEIENPRPSDGQSKIQNPTALRRAGVFFLVSLVLLATAGLFNLSGLSMVSGFLPDWLSRFSFQSRSDAAFNAVFLLTIYDPLLVLAGLAGLAYTILEKDLLKQTLSAWFIGLMILDMVMVGRPDGNVILPLVPLAFLAALALAELWQSLQREGSWGNEGLLLAAGLVIGTFSYIGLTGWLIRTCNADDTICQYAWVQPIAALSLFIIIAVFFGFMTNAGVAARGAALAGVAIGLLAAISIGWRLNFGPLPDLAYQPLAGLPTSEELVMLANTLTRQAEERTGGQKTALDTTLVGISSPALLWQLRDFEDLTRVNSVSEAPPTTAIITPTQVELGMDQPYLGHAFALDALWSPVGLPPKPLISWLLYRHSDELPQGNQVILWLRPGE